MPNYFRNFPTVKHQGQILVDITKRAKFLETIAQNPSTYLPYTIQAGETPDEVSYLYYGTVDYTWMIYLANNMIDPYKDWPLNDNELIEYIADKYKDEYEASTGNTSYTKYDVIAWTQDTTTDDNVLFYRNHDDKELKISVESHTNGALFDPDFDGDEWYKVRIFEEEQDANDDKRVIQVINKIYAEQVAKEFASLMNG